MKTKPSTDPLREALKTIRDKAMDHSKFDREAFYAKDLEALAKIGGDTCDWTEIAIIADEALEAAR